VASSGWPLVSAVPGLMTHLVASLTLDNASWGDSISPDGFLPSILLLLVIIIVVAIVVMVIVVVVVVGEGWANELHQDKASSVRVPVANFTLQSSVQLLLENTDSVRVSLGPVFLVVLSVFAMVAACASRDVVTLLERISKERTKNEAKTTKPDTEWKSMEKTKSRQSPSVRKSTKVNPDKSQSQKNEEK
ncbi:hypothetical protein Tco_1023334, partial [Tanacetum coccineum]